MYCRLAACFRAGMQRKLVYISEEYARNKQQWIDKYDILVKQKYKCARLVPLDLLRADRSTLTVNQWSILSNVTHIYDTLFEEHKQKISHLHIQVQQQPIKTRFKIANYQQLVSTYFTFIVPFLEHIPDYQSLDLFDRQTLVHHNMITLTGIHSHYMASTTQFIPYLDKNYAPTMNMLYGNELVDANEKLRQNLDAIFHTDSVLVKLFLVIGAFSNITPCLSPTSQTTIKSDDDEVMFSRILLRIQNSYVDVLWRYMLFRFRHEELVELLFAKIVYNCLHVQKFTSDIAEENDLHEDMCNTIVEEIESKLDL
jgi:hypothetical protein